MFLRKIILIFACVMLVSCFIQSDDAGLLRHVVAEPRLTGEWVVHKWGQDDVSAMKVRTLRVVESPRGDVPAYRLATENATFTTIVKGDFTFHRLGNTGFMYTGYPSNCDGCYLLRYEVSGDTVNVYTLNTILAKQYLDRVKAPRDVIDYGAVNDDGKSVNFKRFDAQGISLLEEMARDSNLWSLYAVLKRN